MTEDRNSYGFPLLDHERQDVLIEVPGSIGAVRFSMALAGLGYRLGQPQEVGGRSYYPLVPTRERVLCRICEGAAIVTDPDGGLCAKHWREML